MNAKELKRLKDLKYMLNNHDKLFKPKKIKFNIGSWVNQNPEDRNRMKLYPTKEEAANNVCQCDSSACALGSAALYEPFIKDGLKWEIAVKNEHDEKNGWSIKGYYPEEPEFDGFSGTYAGAAFFGISNSESSWLFMPDAYFKANGDNLSSKKITPKMVAIRVAHLIKHYTKYPKKESIDAEYDYLPFEYKTMGVI